MLEYTLECKQVMIPGKEDKEDGSRRWMKISVRRLLFVDPKPIGSSGIYKLTFNEKRGFYTLSERRRTPVKLDWSDNSGRPKTVYEIGDYTPIEGGKDMTPVETMFEMTRIWGRDDHTIDFVANLIVQLATNPIEKVKKGEKGIRIKSKE